MFLLDSWRLAYKEETIDDEVVDNRYMLTSGDFPTAEVLRQQGITQILYVVASEDIDSEEDDLHDLFLAYEQAGIAIHMVDIDSLARSRAKEWEEPWYVEVEAAPLHDPPARVTVVHDPRFYRRAHGGFRRRAPLADARGARAFSGSTAAGENRQRAGSGVSCIARPLRPSA